MVVAPNNTSQTESRQQDMFHVNIEKLNQVIMLNINIVLNV